MATVESDLREASPATCLCRDISAHFVAVKAKAPEEPPANGRSPTGGHASCPPAPTRRPLALYMAAMASPPLREGLPYLMGKEKEEEKTKKTCTQLACAGGRRMVSCVPMGGLHTGLLQSASVLMAACGRRVVRATARLRNSSRLRSLDCTKIASSLATHLSRRISMAALRGRRKKKEDGGGSSSSSEEEEDGMWRRTILMGEKCQPLEFSGVIYYDGKGRRLRGPPRSPLRSPLPSFNSPAAVPSDE